jgi:Recombination endonuclease VII
MPFKDPAKRKEYLRDWQRRMRAKQDPEHKARNAAYERAYKKKQYAENPEFRKRLALRNRIRLYGMTEEQFGDVLANQNGLCALCHEPLFGSRGRSPVIDHDHATGKVRGILHNNCNIAIGMLQDDAKKLRLAAEYLESN